MNCTEIRQALDRLPPRSEPQGPVAEHLRDCDLCGHYYSDLRLQWELAELQVPEPAPGFVDRALAHAAEVVEAETGPAEAGRRTGWQWHWPAAAAASVLAVALGFFALWDAAPLEETAPVALDAVPAADDYYREEVRIVIYSKEDRDRAELSIELAEDLELEGYASSRRLAWNTRLKKGANVLTLPVVVRDGGGEVRVTSSFGGTSHEVKVQVTKGDGSADADTLNEAGIPMDLGLTG